MAHVSGRLDVIRAAVERLGYRVIEILEGDLSSDDDKRRWRAVQLTLRLMAEWQIGLQDIQRKTEWLLERDQMKHRIRQEAGAVKLEIGPDNDGGEDDQSSV